jgi:hypothetical protein
MLCAAGDRWLERCGAQLVVAAAGLLAVEDRGSEQGSVKNDQRRPLAYIGQQFQSFVLDAITVSHRLRTRPAEGPVHVLTFDA